MIFFSFYLTHSLVSSHAEKDRWDRYYRAHKFILSCLVAFSARVKTMLRETCALLGVHIYVYIGCVLQKVFSLPTVMSTRCSSNGNCTENAECSRPQGFCFCQQGFVFFEDVCLPGEYPRGETTQTINTCLDLGAAKKGVDTQT